MTELGNKLKEVREAKGLSLDDLQQVTKIQKRYLVWIEEGNYEMMPGKFYVRAFIKQYCEAIGLEPEEIFEQYKSDVPVVYNEELPEQLSRVKTRKSISPVNSKFLEMFPKVLMAVFIIGAIVLIWVLISKYAGNANDNPNVTDKQAQVETGQNDESPLNKEEEADKTTDVSEDKDQTDKEATETPEEVPEQELTVTNSSGSNSTYALKNTDAFKLKLSSAGSTWIRVKSGNGKTLFQGNILADKPQELDLTNETEVVIRIGKSTETEIYVNDEKLEYAISPEKAVTQNVTIQFTKDE